MRQVHKLTAKLKNELRDRIWPFRAFLADRIGCIGIYVHFPVATVHCSPREDGNGAYILRWECESGGDRYVSEATFGQQENGLPDIDKLANAIRSIQPSKNLKIQQRRGLRQLCHNIEYSKLCQSHIYALGRWVPRQKVTLIKRGDRFYVRVGGYEFIVPKNDWRIVREGYWPNRKDYYNAYNLAIHSLYYANFDYAIDESNTYRPADEVREEYIRNVPRRT